jgi:hypothetical protein
MTPPISWPEGKRFAFTAFDDTDLATCENVQPIYAFLEGLGMRTTKSVWPIAGTGQASMGGATCADDAYRQWLLELQQAGFEIALHNATYHTSPRGETIRAIDAFERIFGHPPKSLTNHTSNAEGIYWGHSRLTGINAIAYSVLTRFSRAHHFRGHRENDPLFWGDVCRERVTYVRNFVFREINTLAACPQMPYHDPSRPYVNYWFASSEGGDVDSFTNTIREENQDRLESEGGACIMYTHFAKGFCRDGRLHDAFRRRMERLAAKNGWFVPVSTLLDYLLQQQGRRELRARDRSRLERKWLLHKLCVGTT